MRPRVLLADDHAIIAEGLARLIDDVADLVGQVNDGVRLVEDTPPPATRHRRGRHHDARHEWYRCHAAAEG